MSQYPRSSNNSDSGTISLRNRILDHHYDRSATQPSALSASLEDKEPLWTRYFLDDPFVKENGEPSPQEKLIKLATKFFKAQADSHCLDLGGTESERAIHVDFALLTSKEHSGIVLKERPGRKSFKQLLVEEPKEVLTCLAYAAHDVIKTTISSTEAKNLFKVTVRIFNFPTIIALKHLKANFIGKFVCIKGTVVRASNIKPMATEMDFVCSRCEAKTRAAFADGKYNPPTTCSNPICRGKTVLTPERTNATTVDWQKIRVQELAQDSEHEAGRIPRTVECELTQDLVDSCVPGDEVTVCGIVKALAGDGEGRGGNKRNSLFLLYIDAISVANSKSTTTSSSNKSSGEESLSEYDHALINEISQDRDPFHLVVNSICPAIFGHEVVKAGLALTLFGGCSRYTSEKNKIPVRGDPHLLIVGDPGLGKSQLLIATSAIAPRGVYVCGNTTSTSGLTVTVVKDPGSGDFSLEAGALVLGDQGVCCIDEFDKMGSEHQALLEAMEQQSISIAKAGIVCNLPCRTSVIAAANPVGGHYNRAKTVSENLKISPALLSRFDLIFILLDCPDAARDQLLSEHVMKLHSNRKTTAEQQKPDIKQQEEGKRKQQGGYQTDYSLSLKDRLKPERIPEHQSDPIPPAVLRKYITFARRFIHPRLSREAAEQLQNFYLVLRKNYSSGDATPITTRQLESLLRLAQARARIELREVVTEQDALDVIDVMKESLYDVLTDDMGQLDFRRASGGTSKTKDANRFIAELNRIAEREDKVLFNMAELFDVAKAIQFPTTNFDNFIDTLNTAGYLLKTGPRTYKLQTASVSVTPSKARSRMRRSGMTQDASI